MKYLRETDRIHGDRFAVTLALDEDPFETSFHDNGIGRDDLHLRVWLSGLPGGVWCAELDSLKELLDISQEFALPLLESIEARPEDYASLVSTFEGLGSPIDGTDWEDYHTSTESAEQYWPPAVRDCHLNWVTRNMNRRNQPGFLTGISLDLLTMELQKAPLCCTH